MLDNRECGRQRAGLGRKSVQMEDSQAVAPINGWHEGNDAKSHVTRFSDSVTGMPTILRTARAVAETPVTVELAPDVTRNGLLRTKPHSDIALVCEAWRLGRRDRGTDAPIPVLSSEALTDFYRAGRFGRASERDAPTSAIHSPSERCVDTTNS